MKGNKEVAMALMEQLLQQDNPVNPLRSLQEEQEQLPHHPQVWAYASSQTKGICELKRFC